MRQGKKQQTNESVVRPKTDLELKTEELKDLKEETKALKKQLTLKARELVDHEATAFNLKGNAALTSFLAGCLASTAQKKIIYEAEQDLKVAQSLLELVSPEEAMNIVKSS